MTAILIMIAAMAASILLTHACVFLFKGWRRRDLRRSPLRGKLHHVPGQQLLDRVNDHGDEVMLAVVAMFLSAPIMLLAWALNRVPWQTTDWKNSDLMFVAGALAIFGYGLRSFIKHWNAHQNARDGLAAERMTAQQLNRLIGSGCYVLHDIPGDGFNIDHVVISPRGVFAVETKSMRKPKGSADDRHYRVTYDGKALVFPDWTTTQPIEQARRQAQWLARWLRESLNQDIAVIPAVALPGWYIESTPDTARGEVRVFTPMGRGAEFMAGTPERHPAATRTLIAQALALRYPDAPE